MTPVEREGFSVIGLQTRTTNDRETQPGGAIPELWERFHKEGLASKIQNRTDGNLLALYTDYASDEQGEYTFVVGAQVLEGTQPPEGMTAISVPPGKYLRYTSERGPVWKVVPEAWKLVWGNSDGRSFRTDFELYDQRAVNPQDAIVELWIGIR